MSRIRLLALTTMTIASGLALVDITQNNNAPTNTLAADHAEQPNVDAQIDTAMHRLNVTRVPAPQDQGTGGTLLPWRDGLLLVGRDGTLHRMRSDLSGFDHQSVDAPFDLASQTAIFGTDINRFKLGLSEAAIREQDGQIDIFAMHTVGYSELECVTVAVSKATLTESSDGTLSQAGHWQRVFEGGPCRPVTEAHLVAQVSQHPMTITADGTLIFEAVDLPYRNLLQDPEEAAGPAPTEEVKLWSLAPGESTARPHGEVPAATAPLSALAATPPHTLTGAEFPRWHGDLLVGAPNTNALIRFRTGQTGQIAYKEDIAIGESVRALTEDGQGRLALRIDQQPYIMLLSSGDRFKANTTGVPRA